MNNAQFVDRRSGHDRRSLEDLRQGDDRRSGYDRRHTDPLSPGGRSGTEARLDMRASFRDAAGRAPTVAGNLSYPPSIHDFLAGIGTVLTNVVSGFYEASMDPKLWPEVLGKLRDALHADAAAVICHDFEQGRGQIEHSVSIDAMFVTAYREFYSRQNIWLQRAEQFRHAGTVLTSRQLIDAGTLVETDYYRYWLRPQNLFHHLMGVLETQGSQVTMLSFARARDKGAFWEDDSELLFRLLPYLRQGLRAGGTMRRVQDVERILLDTLDVMPIGIAVLGCSGVVLNANRVAREIIDSEEALYMGSGGLGLKLAAGRFRFRDFLAGSSGEIKPDPGSETHTFSVPREGGKRPLTLLVMPVKDRTQRRTDRDPGAVLFIGDPERPVDIDPRQLVRMYNLSRAEARVAVLLARGLRLDQSAQHLGLTYETVRKHLKQIFAKTGTDRQAELVRTLTSGPSGLRL
ncbi:MAG TPA: helix-turn-helix transcriptional regulator [Rhodospirillales bacterium]|nr:helix-turn-helix transcriptional regulator [Rhodospirillales bacterium]